MKFTTLGPAAKAAGHTRYAAVAKAGRGRPVRVGAVLAAAALAVGLSACSSGSSSSGSTSGNTSAPTGSALTIADVAPFSGVDAPLGPTYLASCYGATSAIHNAGGVLGHKLACKTRGTRGHPAHAVPPGNQMVAAPARL